jgi:hypothetical protein
MNKQPKALRLADALVSLHGYPLSIKAAAELRRLHSVNDELLDALKLARLVVNPAHAYGIAIEAAIAKAQG